MGLFLVTRWSSERVSLLCLMMMLMVLESLRSLLMAMTLVFENRHWVGLGHILLLVHGHWVWLGHRHWVRDRDLYSNSFGDANLLGWNVMLSNERAQMLELLLSMSQLMTMTVALMVIATTTTAAVKSSLGNRTQRGNANHSEHL